LDRCESCKGISRCSVCGKTASGFQHVGVRAASKSQSHLPSHSGIWHYAKPCGHRNHVSTAQAVVKYNGGPLWKDGYTWQNVYWGTYFTSSALSGWVKKVEKAVLDIETDNSYSGGLSQYNVGTGRILPFTIIKTNPPTKITDNQIRQALASWISSNQVSNLGPQGAYNIFMPQGTTVTLSPLEASCSVFCDYHNAVGPNGPFYTVEPYPCTSGCNHCSKDPFDTLTQGLSEEMVELKTDMDPGTGWVIGNEELCDFCDRHFVCNQISTGEYVNSWYDQAQGVCWKQTTPMASLDTLPTGIGTGKHPVSH
jgi:hypothetical protein